MNRRTGALLACLATACGTGDARPNLLLISVDTLRPDFLGCYGHERATSPAIDSLAARGVLFEDVTSASPWTLPSHASMLTGMYAATHGVKDHEFRLESETLATWLARVGYQTMSVVNTHNIGFEDYGLMRGFDPRTKEWVNELGEQDPETLITPVVNRAEDVIARARAFLGTRDASRPFFLFLHFYDVHTDFTPAPEWEQEFVKPYKGRLPGAWTAVLTTIRKQGLALSKADVRFLTEMYEAEIRTFDDRLGELFAYLEQAGLLESTVIALTSDHGEEFLEHGSVLHGRTHYQELVRIPLLLAGPGVAAGLRVKTPVHLVDLAPTLYALLGVPAAPSMDGLDLSGAWGAGPALPDERVLFSEADHNNVVDGVDRSDVKRMARSGNTVLHLDTVTGRTELYDLATDPAEREDLSSAQPDRVAFLLEELRRHMQRRSAASTIGPVSEENRALLEQLGYGGE